MLVFQGQDMVRKSLDRWPGSLHSVSGCARCAGATVAGSSGRSETGPVVKRRTWKNVGSPWWLAKIHVITCDYYRWCWFQAFFGMFHPEFWGDNPIGRWYFSTELVQPPTRFVLLNFSFCLEVQEICHHVWYVGLSAFTFLVKCIGFIRCLNYPKRSQPLFLSGGWLLELLVNTRVQIWNYHWHEIFLQRGGENNHQLV